MERCDAQTGRWTRTLCLSAVEADGADVIFIAGAPLAGLARSTKDRIPVPVVDGVSSAVCHAQTLVSLNPVPGASSA